MIGMVRHWLFGKWFRTVGTSFSTQNSIQVVAITKKKWSKSFSRVQLFVTPWTALYSPGDSPGQKTAVGSLSLLQRIFLAQESNPGLLHCRQILYQVSYQGSPTTKKGRKQWRIHMERHTRMHQDVSLHEKNSLNLLKSIKNQTGRKATTSSLHMQLRCHDPVKY